MIESIKAAKSCDIILSINTNWAQKEIGKYYVHINKLSRDLFLKKYCGRKIKIKNLIDKI